jgi:CRISPR-associated protein Cas2
LLDIYNKDSDSLRFYQLGSKWQHRVEHYGIKGILDLQNDTLLI